MNTIIPVLTEEDFLPVGHSGRNREAIVRPSTRYWSEVGKRLIRDKMALFCLSLIVIISLMALIVPLLSPYDYDQTNLKAVNQGPSQEHWFGTDTAGRDLFTRVWQGSRISLAIGFLGAIAPFVIGLVIGGLSGWFGGWIDMVIMRLIDIGLCIPQMIYIIIIMLLFGGGPLSLVIAFAVMGWMGSARGFRGRVLQFKNREFSLSARTLGATPLRIIFRHILPNITGNLVVGLTASIPAAIFMEASLSFIGLGIQPPMTSLGQLAADGIPKFRIFPYQLFLPSVVVSIIIFAFYMFGNRLRDALDPKLKDMTGKKAKKGRGKRREG